MHNSLDELNKITEIFADTADFRSIKPYTVSEVTTNPIAIFQAATLPQYKNIFQTGVDYGLQTGKTPEEAVDNAMDMINVLFGEEILRIVNKRVHIQLDPRLAFDTTSSVTRAIKIIKLFEEKGINKERVAVKIPATWEGIQAAKILETNYKVICNMTTMFCLTQAAASLDAGVSYLSPFVGRINIWYQQKYKTTGRHEGVETLKLIQQYIRKYGYKTKVLGAYFVNSEEVKAVAGCDTCTLPVNLLEDFVKNKYNIINNINKEMDKLPDKLTLSEANFRWLMNEDEMVADLLPEMLRIFADHYVKLEHIVKKFIK